MGSTRSWCRYNKKWVQTGVKYGALAALLMPGSSAGDSLMVKTCESSLWLFYNWMGNSSSMSKLYEVNGNWIFSCYICWWGRRLKNIEHGFPVFLLLLLLIIYLFIIQPDSSFIHSEEQKGQWRKKISSFVLYLIGWKILYEKDYIIERRYLCPWSLPLTLLRVTK